MKISKNAISFGLLVAGIITIGGCATTIAEIQDGYTTDVTGKTYPATVSSKVILVYKDQPDAKNPCKNYKTIGKVSVGRYDPYLQVTTLSPETVRSNLRKAGASLGANAVINIGNYDGFHDSGYAIRCKGMNQSYAVNKQVLESQKLLNQHGYATGVPDGVMGPKTRDAIISFQKANGLTVDGKVSELLLSHLR